MFGFRDDRAKNVTAVTFADSLPKYIGIYKTQHFLLNLTAATLVALAVVVALILRSTPRPDAEPVPCAWSHNKNSASGATIGTF